MTKDTRKLPIQKKRRKSAAERSKSYRQRQKKAFEDKTMNRIQLKNYLLKTEGLLKAKYQEKRQRRAPLNG